MKQDEIQSLGDNRLQATLTRKERAAKAKKKYAAKPEAKAKVKARLATPLGRAQRKAILARYDAKDSTREKQKARISTPEGKALARERVLKYRSNPANREKERARNRLLNSTPKGLAAKRQKEHKRRAAKNGSTIGDTRVIAEWERAWKRRVSVACYWCMAKVNPSTAHSDHIMPISKGGAHALENLCISCAKCNLAKSSKLPSDWNATLSQPVLLL